ncbi:hypothetical protein M0812_17763 [Anaeramoeba flamelloides]|uniref:Uncharacterized protein n=1 Tax=Anaeramoeba flamelloides TaxID=1746091 RepID=A0AAV7Z3S3_9EUKA|nr:hypothetical protein M0812_17763 [Anaeramoeba flamelloides]|eukprot:Anaeramoba_flamelloidesc42456_g3_i2.p1 GENE.c42456_g3_i2~~c42456_g3_i2.p1  ORF type:complete len:733 (+),score=105.86 c42456_g3_i2:58-2256(+)
MLKQNKRHFYGILLLFLLLVFVYVLKPTKWINHLDAESTYSLQIRKCFQELPQDKFYFSDQISCPIENKKNDLTWQVSSLKNSLMNACQPHSQECAELTEDNIKRRELREYSSAVLMRNSLNFHEPKVIKFEETANQNMFRDVLQEYCLDRVSNNLTGQHHHASVYKTIANDSLKAESLMRYIIKSQDGAKLGEISRGEEFDYSDYPMVNIQSEYRKGPKYRKVYPLFNYRKDQEVLDRVQRRIERIEAQEQANRKKRGISSDQKPEKMNVLLMLNDALSHLRYVRIFSIFREWLDRKVNAGQIEYFAFRRYHVMGWFSTENQPPFYMGTKSNVEKRIPGYPNHEQQNCGKLDGKVKEKDCDRILWNKYREEGYLTIDSRDRFDGRYLHQCHDKYVRNCHKESEWGSLYADIVIPNNTFGDIFSVLSFTTLNWLEQALKEHVGQHPIFATATNMNFHTVPRKMSATIWEMMSFLETVDFENTMIILHSDHGFHYTQHAYNEAGFNEHKFPQLLFIMPKRFLDKNPWMRENLQNNVNRLFSHFDLYTTMREFPRMQSDMFENEFTKKGDGGSFKYDHLVENTYNLFTERIPKDRTCKQANIDPGYCVCVKWEKSYSPVMKLKAFIHAKRSIKVINRRIRKKGSNCLPLKYARIENLEQTVTKKQMRYHLIGKVDGKKDLIRFQIFWSKMKKDKIPVPIRVSKMSDAEVNNKVPEDLGIDPHICFLKDEEESSI